MTRKYEIIAIDTNSELDCGFTVKFEKARDIYLEGMPFHHGVAIKAVEDAYDWFPTTKQIMEFDEGEWVGYVHVDEEGNYIKSECVIEG